MENKEIISANLIKYRKLHGISQLELATKLNYSDKAISKWEQGEAFPDIFIFIKLAQIYQITVNDLLYYQDKIVKPDRKRKKTIICLLTAFAILLLATTLFYTLEHFQINYPNWLIFIFYFPICSTVLLILNFIWGKRIYTHFLFAIIIWTGILSLQLGLKLHPLVYLIGIPSQAVAILGTNLKSSRQKIL